jgi:hypothetical protein
MVKSLLKKLVKQTAIFFAILLSATLLLLIFKIDLFVYVIVGYLAFFGFLLAKKFAGVFVTARKSYYLFCCKMFFRKSHPEINFSDFTGSRLERIIRLNARRRDLDAPRLSEQELIDLCFELDKKNLAFAGKVAGMAFLGPFKAMNWVLGSMEQTKEQKQALDDHAKQLKVDKLKSNYDLAQHRAREVKLGITVEANFAAGAAHEALADAKFRLQNELKEK